MKRFIIILLTASLANCLAVAGGFGIVPLPPSLPVKPYSLPEAYIAAIATLRGHTNEYECIGARLETREHYPHYWTFQFSGTTNTEFKSFEIRIFDQQKFGTIIGSPK